MVSSTQQTERRRLMRKQKMGRKAAKKAQTPSFPLQPEGYDPKAADAKPAGN